MPRLLCFVLVMLATTVTASTVTRSVRSTGEAAILDGDLAAAATSARQRALREAVESGIGVLISSTTRASNYAVIEDEIFSATRGYVRSYEVVSEGQLNADTYALTLEAEVDLQQLEHDLAAVDLVHAMAGRPRFLCRGVVSTPDGETRWSPELTEQLRLELAPLGERLDPATAGAASVGATDAELARAHGADLLVDGYARFERHHAPIPGQSGELGDMGIVSTSAALTLEIRWLDEVSPLRRWQTEGRGASIRTIDAEALALSRAVVAGGDTLRHVLIQDLRDRAFSDRLVHLLIEGDSEDLAHIERSWPSAALTRGALRPHGFENGQGRYDVTVAGSAFDLARLLSARGFPSLDVEVLQVSANRIRMRVSAPVDTAARQ